MFVSDTHQTRLELTMVPEPDTILFVGLGLAGLAFAGSRRRLGRERARSPRD
jgi:hypothetical protein